MPRILRRVAVPLAGALALTLGIAAPASAESADQAQVTIMSTTDVHARLLNWDYLQDRAANGLGLARISTMVDEVRSQRAPGSTLLVDNGDTIQGTTLGRYYAGIEPITEGVPHPIAQAMNHIGYDTMTLGNHEFNFGVPTLREFERQLDATVLGANVLEAGTETPAFAPYVIKTIDVPGAAPINVGILGITTPGSAIWDRAHVEGRLDFADGVDTARTYVPEMRERGADIVVAALHTGLGTGSSYGDQIPYLENFGTLVAEEVPGIDVLIAGHSHSSVAQRFVTNKVTGAQVIVSQAGSFASRLGVTDLTLEETDGGWSVVSAAATQLNAGNYADDPEIVELVGAAHQKVVDYVNAPAAISLQELTLRNSMTEDIAAIDMMAEVQLQRAREGLVGTPYEDLPLLSARSPLTTSAVTVPAGRVSVRQLSSLYIYDNNVLMAVKINGAEVVEFLEWVASYYTSVTDDAPKSRSSLIRGSNPAWFTQHIYGLTYDIDLAKPVGERLVNVRYQGEPIDPAQDFILATDNYVIGGGGDAPVLPQAEVVFNPLESIQEEITVWAAEKGVIDAKEFHSVDWRLVVNGTPVTFTDSEQLPASIQMNQRALAGKAYLSVSITNGAAVPVDMTVTTPHGAKTFRQVAPGTTVAASVNTRLTDVPAGAVQVAVTGVVDDTSVTETKTASYGAYSVD